ncbi:MAG TPA: type II toxin-antitoxin system VapC family toxin [Dehalococcoidia bacterium]|nr:type II toxin-antitoxin system VapC family toxin [Dehalococcoidia bacterium]
MAFVLDASVALAWHFEDEASAYVDRVLERLREDDALVPAIWPLEVANGLLAAERRGRLSAADVAAAHGILSDLPVTMNTLTLDEALGSVLDLARAQGLSAYDAAYLGLAMREGLALATQDDDLRAAATRVGVALVD